jgi:hypothetical protein
MNSKGIEETNEINISSCFFIIISSDCSSLKINMFFPLSASFPSLNSTEEKKREGDFVSSIFKYKPPPLLSSPPFPPTSFVLQQEKEEESIERGEKKEDKIFIPPPSREEEEEIEVK